MNNRSDASVLSDHNSYLGNGLYAARLATLGALGADGKKKKPAIFSICTLRFSDIKLVRVYGIALNSCYLLGLDWKVFTSSCLPKKFREDVTFGGITYQVSGIPDGKIRVALRFRALSQFFWIC